MISFTTESALKQKQVTLAVIGSLLFACATRLDDSKRLLADAERLALLSNFPKAAPLFDQASTLFKRSGDRRNALYARLGYLWTTADAGRTAEGDVEIDRACADPLVQDDLKLRLRCLVAKAARERVVNEASARTTWEEIHNLAKAVGDGQWQARAQAELGQITYMEGNVTTAVGMFKQAILSQFFHRDVGAAIYYSSMVGNGLVEAGQSENGLSYCNAAIRLASVVKEAGFPFLAYQGKARALIGLHRVAEAKIVLQSALTQARVQQNRAAETQLLIVAGAGAQEHAKAIQSLKAANDLSERGRFDHAFAWSALELAKAYRDAGDLAAAETYATRGLAAMRDLEDKYHLPQHLALLADLKAQTGKFRAAQRLYERAADVIDAVLVNAPSRQIQSSLISTMSSVYLGHFALAATKLKDIRKAYEVIERARGRSLADALRGENRIGTSTDPLTLSAQEQINFIQLELLHETELAKRQELLERLFETEQVFTPIGEPVTPLRSALTHVKPVSLSDLQSHLHPDETVLEYVLDEPRSFCVRITRINATIFVLPEGRNVIEHAIDEYLAETLAGKPGIEVGRRLYTMLLRPVLRWNDKSELIVVPDGKLNFLPFDSTIDLAGRRMVNSHAVSYCPSGTVLYLMRTPVTQSPTLNFLGVGDVRYPAPSNAPNVSRARGVPVVPDFLALHTGGFGDIPNTRDEIIAASNALGGYSTLLLGRDATEAAVKSQPLASFDIIHFATHGVPSTEFPDRAALVLAPDDRSHEDGLLQVREIRKLPIHAELVTLSACDTGIGSLEGQEGVANLVRAFLFAGAKSVVASLWTASDVYTVHLMRRFYGYLAKGEARSVALQRAKIDSLREFGSDAVPFYWAGFVIVGDASSPIVGARKANGNGSPPGRQLSSRKP